MIKKEICRTAVFVSGGGSNLQAIIDAENQGLIKSSEIKLVISTNPNAFALVRARNHNIPMAIVCRKDCENIEEFESKLLKLLEKNRIDLIVLAGFMTILSADFVKKYEKRIINIHPSLIPSFCGKGFYGLSVHKAALDYGVKVTGATAHYVNEIPDGGEIILQRSICIKKGESPESLQQRVMRRAEWVILPRAVEIAAKRIIAERKKEK